MRSLETNIGLKIKAATQYDYENTLKIYFTLLKKNTLGNSQRLLELIKQVQILLKRTYLKKILKAS